MKNIIRTFGALAVMLVAISANAQHTISVTVPFAFVAAGQILPAGDYRVSFDAANSVVTLSRYHSSSVRFMTATGNRLQDERNVLRFYRYGNELSLREIAFGGEIQRVPPARTRMKQVAVRDSSTEATSVEVPVQSIDRHASSEGKEN